MFCTVVEGTSCVLVVGWKSTFAEVFVFVLGGPTAAIGVERRSLGSPGPGIGKTEEVGLGLGLDLGLNRRQVAEFLTVIALLEIVSTGEKSK